MGEFATEAEAEEAVQAKAQRDATFEQRRDDEYYNEGFDIPTADRYGPDPQNLLAALGHWAEWDLPVAQNDNGATKIRREQEGAPEEGTAKRLAANAIKNHYMIQKPADLNALENHDVDHDTLLDLSCADSRVQVLDNLVQNVANNRNAENTCAASSLLGAAVLGGKENGTEGVTALLDAMKANATPEQLAALEGDKDKPGALTDIRTKIAAGQQLSTGDMHLIQGQLYQQLQDNEIAAAKAKLAANPHDPEAQKALFKAGDSGIQSGTLKNFIGNAPAFQQMMKDNEMGISFIQNDPNARESNHAVLTMGHGREDGAYTVYDPQLRDDGQVITNTTELDNYKNAESMYIAP
ncbi:MAG: hypothetical protein ACKV2T_04170 [Kofleriaceae bacterium]